MHRVQNAAYCCRCSVVRMSVCLQDRTRSCAKTAGLIEMPFGKWTRIDPRNQIFGEGLDSLGERAFFGGGAKERPPGMRPFPDSLTTC